MEIQIIKSIYEKNLGISPPKENIGALQEEREKSIYLIYFNQRKHSIIKVREDHSEKRLLREARTLEFLINKLPVPRILTKGVDPLPFLIQEYIEGRTLDKVIHKQESKALIMQSGRLLAHLHSLNVGVGLLEDKYEREMAYWGNFLQEYIRRSALPTQDRKRLCDLLRKFLELPFKGNNNSLLHYDYHPANLIEQNGEIRAILDFEYSMKGQEIFDLTKVEFYFLTLFPGNFNAFIKGYEKRRDLPKEYADQRCAYLAFHISQVIHYLLKNNLKGIEACLKAVTELN